MQRFHRAHEQLRNDERLEQILRADRVEASLANPKMLVEIMVVAAL